MSGDTASNRVTRPLIGIIQRQRDGLDYSGNIHFTALMASGITVLLQGQGGYQSGTVVTLDWGKHKAVIPRLYCTDSQW